MQSVSSLYRQSLWVQSEPFLCSQSPLCVVRALFIHTDRALSVQSELLGAVRAVFVQSESFVCS